MNDRTRVQRFSISQLRRSEVVHALFVALIICCFLFPDALFLRAGLTQTSRKFGELAGQGLVSFYPQPPHRKTTDSSFDGGGSLYQMEPAQQFMRFCFKKGESPYWNPYSGAGQLGPETLVDLKFSFQNTLIALLGGSQTVINLVLIFSYYVAISFLYLFCVRRLHFGAIAAVAVCLAFAFNGYSTSTLGSNTAQTYPYFPILLYSLTTFALKPRAVSFALLTIIDAVILSTTFLPTTFLVLITAHLIALVFTVANAENNRRRIFLITLTQILSSLLAFCSLAFLYFPIIESFSYVDAISMYGERIYYPASLNSLLSFFSCKHFWEEYCAIPPSLLNASMNVGAIRVTNAMCHFGVTTSIVAICAIFMTGKKRLVAITCVTILFFSIGRIFGIPGINDLIGVLPGLRSIGEQYWFMTVACVFPLAVGFGFESFRGMKTLSLIAPTMVSLTVLAAVAYLNSKLGISAPDETYKQMCVTVVCVTTLIATGLVIFAVKNAKVLFVSSIALITLLGSELIFDFMYYRYLKTDGYRNPSFAAQFLQKVSGVYRTANLNEGVVPAEFGAAFQIPQLECLNMNILPTYETFFQRHFLTPEIPRWGRFCTFFNLNEISEKNWKLPIKLEMFDLTGTKFIVCATYWFKTRKLLEANGYVSVFNSERWQIYENKNVYPRAFAVKTFYRSNDMNVDIPKITRSVAFTIDPELLKAAEAAKILETNALASVAFEEESVVTINSYHHDTVSLTTNTNVPSIVILTDNWHPNWHATIDGQPAHIGLVDETFRGVVAPAGKHQIVMHYRPKSLTSGQIMSAAALLALCLIVRLRKRIDKIGI